MQLHSIQSSSQATRHICSSRSEFKHEIKCRSYGAKRNKTRILVSNQQGKGPSPIVLERFQSVASQLMSQRIIRLGGAVDDDSCNLIVAQLLWLDAADPEKDITLYVNSPGGSVTAGMAVFDTMRHIRPNVSTVCVGLAASMGAFLLASGQQGKRYSLPNSRIMIHQPLGGAQGQAADIEIQANEIMVGINIATKKFM